MTIIFSGCDHETHPILSWKMEIIYNNILFKQITDFKDYYVSKCGRVYSKKTNIILKQTIAKDKRKRVTLRGRRVMTKLVHRLVALTFIPNPDNKPEVNHIDGNPGHNNINNLEWCTASENMKHSYRVLNRKNANLGKSGINKDKFGKLHHQSKKVIQYDLNNNYIKTWDGVREVSRVLNFHNTSIAAVCRGERKTAHNYKWKYKEITEE